ncbi:pimeloyl-ACP methyl ester carboxylesterase [Actinoplanes octamycinicus]|uniref:Pimeloyl-ACP methyl ester carboxylesterase n=1 Tax=Actinoplanes octamycinicus TaxID=135948 RepID=A0A7W7M846_9ACTN|nr:alpha/beta hydrolase [Actinoplanes octamycinicus]MBB4740508.1 pimeloyl-ACP methyl ester carboxylesterase [Actinoplanes octamycinicus]GIE59769.1 peptidase [Actinoplanes octamycinicus]
MRKILAATVAASVGLLIGAGTIPAAAAAHGNHGGGYTPPPIDWGKCASAGLQARGAECGFLVVPLDYAKPGGTKIKVAVSRIKHKSSEAQYQGVMITNPGGPGGSGLTLSVLGEYVPNGAGDYFDWIGFDPRGVGSSVPSLSCDPNYFGYNRPYYVPVTRQLENTWRAKAKGYAKACDRAGGALLDHVKTTDTVADVESLRKALGQKQINYYGFSYGTYLGQVYATLHPDKIRKAVFDGVVNPDRVWYDANLDQDIQFDKNMDVYFGWVAKYDSVYHLGTTARSVKAKYYATLQQLRKAPAAGKIGPDEWNDIFVSAGYYVFGWEEVAGAFSAWVNDKNADALLALYAEPGAAGSDNGYAMYLATQCSDVKWPTNWSKWQRDNWKIYAKYPFITWNNAWYNAPCIDWGTKPGKPVRINGTKAPAFLLISETEDAATPYDGALRVRQLFPKSVLLEGVGGTTHAGSLNGVACTDNLIADYLATGALPDRVRGNRSDAQCDPVPQPDPTAAAALKAASSADGGSRALVRPSGALTLR